MSELPVLTPASRIVDVVQDALREAILTGALRGGEPLSVPELARRLKVSRSPVREAVLGLVGQGLAVEQPRRGVVVATIETKDLLAIHEIREFLEAAAARLCAQRIDAAGIARLERIMAEQAEAVRLRAADGYFATNAALHREIATHAANARLAQILDTLENQMRLALHRIATDPTHMEAGYTEHARVVAAIAARDADAAEQAMRAHIAATIGRIKAAGV